jgi:hypothetical protein
MMKSLTRINPNGVNGASSEYSGCTSPGSGVVKSQATHGRHQTTGRPTRRRYSREDNRAILECYYASRPDELGYRQRMHRLWIENGGFNIDEQRMADQVRNIIKRKWFTDEELEEVRAGVTETEVDEMMESGEGEARLGSVQVAGETVELSESAERERVYLREPDETERIVIDEILSKRASVTTSRPNLKPLRQVERKVLMNEVRRMDSVLDCVETKDITELNDTILACAAIVSEKVSKNGDVSKKVPEPAWKIRLQRKVKMLGQDISRVTECKNRDYDDPMRVRLEKKYNIRKKGFDVVLEELKENLQAKSQKIKRYTERQKQYRENRMFVNNQKQFYRKLGGTNSQEQIVPDKKPTVEFWQGIWSVKSEHNRNAPWLSRLKENMDATQQEDLKISAEDVRSVLARAPNWKAPGPDGVQGFWLKSFRSLHARMAVFLQECLDDAKPPVWMTSGRTALIVKDPTKGNQPGNYRPITCLPLMWKTLTGILADKLYDHLENQGVLGDEQLGCRNRRGTKEHLMLDKIILKDCRKRNTNLAMGWIDYQKAYDLLPHSWIIETMKLTGIARNAVNLMESSMETWNTRLEYAGEELAGVQIRRGIFQGDSLSPLLFVVSLLPLSFLLRGARQGYKLQCGRRVNHLLFMDDLKLYGKSKADLEGMVNTVRIFSDDIRMKFGLQKCATMLMKRGKKIEDDGIRMPDGQMMEDLGSEAYKYLGVLEADKIKMEAMKEKVRANYYCRLRKLLKSSLNGGNVIKAVNTWAVAAVRYTAGILDWTLEELQNMDRKTRKLMTMNRALHPRADVDRLYLPRKSGGRGMMSIEEVVRLEESGLSDYVKFSEASGDGAFEMFVGETSKKECQQKQRKERETNWKQKPLHGQYPVKAEEMGVESWRWLETGWLKKETEGLLMAAQDQSLPTKSHKVKIMKEQGSSNCRMCGSREETVMHILSECEKLAQTEYRKRHDKVATIIHWELCALHGFERSGKWYDHRAKAVLESEDVKILWDFNIWCDRLIEARRPDIVLINKRNKETMIIDIAVPGDFRVKEKETEKIHKYQDLVIEVNRIWSTRARVIPIVIGALGSVHHLQAWLALLQIEQRRFDNIQQAALLGSAHILRKVLSI